MGYENFARQLRKFGPAEVKYFKEVMNRGRLSIFENEGGLVDQFESAFAQYTGAKVALARSNGMAGLADAMSVSGAGVATEVLCDPVVHFGALATTFMNAVPRFVDIEPDTYNMDPASLEANITPNARAVIVTHLWGLPARIDAIKNICRQHNLFLIEDCAHTIGAYWKGKHVGNFGDIGVFSFQEYKQLSTGDGAMLTLNNRKLAYQMENIWQFSGESPVVMTLNWRMNEMTAAVGLAQLQRVDDIVSYYNRTLKIYNDAIAGCSFLKPRVVPKGAVQAAYWFACTWQGDKLGLSYDRFQQLNRKMKLGLRFGFNQTAPYEYDFFKDAKAYGDYHCPTQCAFYTQKSDYHYRKGLCPVVEDVMPRLVTASLIFKPMEDAKREAERLHQAIRIMEK